MGDNFQKSWNIVQVTIGNTTYEVIDNIIQYDKIIQYEK
jgi:hypothetical protein